MQSACTLCIQEQSLPKRGRQWFFVVIEEIFNFIEINCQFVVGVPNRNVGFPNSLQKSRPSETLKLETVNASTLKTGNSGRKTNHIMRLVRNERTTNITTATKQPRKKLEPHEGWGDWV